MEGALLITYSFIGTTPYYSTNYQRNTDTDYIFYKKVTIKMQKPTD